MGIHELSHVIGDRAPSGVQEVPIKSYSGHRVAIDTPIIVYQALSRLINADYLNGLVDDEGNSTSHLQILFYRIIDMKDIGIKPVFVFDGEILPEKEEEISRRKERKEKAKSEASAATDPEMIANMAKRSIHVTPEIIADAKKLIQLMGCPIVDSLSDAEAQCSYMAKVGIVDAVVSEDMDSLTFGAPILIRNFRKQSLCREYDLKSILEQMDLTMVQFVDLCILLGCDYCPKIKGIGKKKAVELIKKYGSMEEILKNIDRSKFKVPEDVDFVAIRNLFLNPKVLSKDEINLVWKGHDSDGLLEFLKTKGFNEDRIKKNTALMDEISKRSVKIGKQTKLTFFNFKVDKKRTSPPKQQHNVSKKMKK